MEKDGFRRLMRDMEPIDPGVGLLVTSSLFVWLSRRLPGTIAAYMAMRDEIDVTPLFERLPGWRWVLPRVENDLSLTFRDRDVDLELHDWGMQQPVDSGETVPISQLDVILVPGLAFDRAGARMGRGAGYYDRVLAERRSDSVAVGVTTEERVLGSVPVESHDQRVEWLATEAGVRECSPRR